MMRLYGCSDPARAARRGDIDIAILPRDELPSGFFGELDADLEESTIPYDVDLVDLRNADPVLIAEILREGIPWRE
jgi:hypothetical protein